MSRYEPLAQFLVKRPTRVWNAAFDEVESILGFRLPPSAYRYSAWWANQRGPGHSQTNGWCAVGWRTSKVDLAKKQVTFERGLENSRSQAPDADDPGNDFAVRGAIEFLIGLGGTMPDYQPAPRN
jgi:hypothetical protein